MSIITGHITGGCEITGNLVTFRPYDILHCDDINQNFENLRNNDFILERKLDDYLEALTLVFEKKGLLNKQEIEDALELVRNKRKILESLKNE